MALPTPHHGACCVCDARDARLLVRVELRGEAKNEVTLCGSHALMHRRLGETATSVAELKALLRDRRDRTRRATGEVDELAEALTAAFAQPRRVADRRAT